MPSRKNLPNQATDESQKHIPRATLSVQVETSSSIRPRAGVLKISMESVVKSLGTSHFRRSSEDDRPIVVMTCGMAGSGKTTLAKAIQAAHPGFHRLSIDEMLYEAHGIYGVDYEASSILYSKYQDEVDVKYVASFRTLLSEKQDIIIERSFYAKEDRDEYRKMAEEAGARVVIMFLKAEGEDGKELLWTRICKRSEGKKTADSALDISRDLFESYWSGFENPVGEGEIVVKVL
ncbi:P-loop containing nucleoside triphosphate hydrolase protein [Phaeosphaeriaceae sp. PMI808]|nr:P-loop containing nucleoside triphosphate hydrolase protein [Phaeosphaeriaceae sp. PMI808]